MARGKGKPFVKGDKRCNRKGRPPLGETYAEILRAVGSMTGDEVADLGEKLAKDFRALPKGVNLKTLACLWAFASLSREFSASVFNAIVDRTDGTLGDLYEARLVEIERYIEEKSNAISQAH